MAPDETIQAIAQLDVMPQMVSAVPALIIGLPLLGAVLLGLARFFSIASPTNKFFQVIPCLTISISAILAVQAFVHINLMQMGAMVTPITTWMSVGNFHVDWILRWDSLTAMMGVVVTVVASVVHWYSLGYMSHDKSPVRFMAYLNLFTVAMLMLVAADNLLMLFFGWEAVGLASYLLIGFWGHKDSATAASMKAFLVNRVGDFGFALGILAVFALTGYVAFDPIFAILPSLTETDIILFGAQIPALELTATLLFLGAVGKSAQLGLHTWLPDAMEGPTPVSALIHAATMVTAGVFMVARLSPLFELTPITMGFMTILGALTALIAATIALTQYDIKRIIAYSTMSQLGYMFFALGVSAYGAALFHLFTHAFFKALLFLGAGSVIHALADEQDLRKMGGLWRKLPITYAYMMIGSLALAGIPLLAGFYSKDMVLQSVWAATHMFEGTSTLGGYAYWIGVLVAMMTAFYSWRLLIMAFHGKPRGDAGVHNHAHEASFIMNAPMAILAVGAVVSGYWGYDYFVGDARMAFWSGTLTQLGEDVIEAAHHVPMWVKKTPLAAAVTGILLGYGLYLWTNGIPALISRVFAPIHTLFYRKWFIDELYDRLFTRPAWFIGRFLTDKGDRGIIDRYGPDGVAKSALRLGGVLRWAQSGYVFRYAMAMLLGVMGLVLWVLI